MTVLAAGQAAEDGPHPVSFVMVMAFSVLVIGLASTEPALTDWQAIELGLLWQKSGVVLVPSPVLGSVPVPVPPEPDPLPVVLVPLPVVLVPLPVVLVPLSVVLVPPPVLVVVVVLGEL